jgi:membrane protease YdiL (CAAX protease family)
MTSPSIQTRRAAAIEIVALTLVVSAIGWLTRDGAWSPAMSAVLLYAPLLILSWRGRPSTRYGYALSLWRRGLPPLLMSIAGLLVPLVAIVMGWRLAHGGGQALWPGQVTLTVAVWQAVLVVIPEEMFFRGYVQARLGDAAFGPNARIVATAALFTASHLVVESGWMRLLVFVPGLVTSWLRERSGGLLAPAGFHWLSNLTAAGLHL